jgi:uncharacterized protein (DUF1697 family)
MPRYVALLRAINVGGHVVKMAELRAHFESLGFKNVETFIASGNVIFDARSSDASALQRKIEGHLRGELGYDVVTILRSQAEIRRIAVYRPFTEAQFASSAKFNVGFFAEPLGAEAKKVIMGLQTDVDDFYVDGREMYWLCKVLSLESVFSASRLEKVLKASVTFRGMNTVVRLAEKHCSE